MQVVTIVMLCLCVSVESSDLYETLMRIYASQGLPFREDKFLNNGPILDEYDFVVIGSGPAGSAVANRLSEIPEWKVLLLEAGMEGNIYNDIPALSPFFILTNYSWGYKSERQPSVCLGLEDEICLWPSGKGVGGASIMNGMLYTRGHPSDFDRWAADGNPGWSYKEVLPYFLKAERMTIHNLKNSPYHSSSGLVNIEYPQPSPLVERFLRSGRQSGYELVDYNDARTPVGFSKSQTTMKNGKRFSAASAYLFPIKARPNFHIAKNAFVTKILIDQARNIANGVLFKKNGKSRKVTVRKEIILSAGAFNSPKILMLSGIGPKEHLQEHQIPIYQDLPVGNNLQEHLSAPAVTFLINTTDSYHLRKLIFNSISNSYRYVKFGAGPLSNNGAEAIAYIRTNKSDPRPDVELIFLPATLASDDGILLRKTMGITDESFYPTFDKIGYAEGFSIWPMGMYPESKGMVRLRSSNPHDPPRLFPNFFTNHRDLEIIIAGIKASISLGNTDAFKEIGARLHTIPFPGCEKEGFGSDQYFECLLRRVPLQLHHQCCTCKMGPDPKSSVVDSNLRVHGVKGLRIADTSIMPSITGAHTMAPAYMIGEKAADIIKTAFGIRNMKGV